MTDRSPPNLDPDEFAAVFAAIHGTDPFPWQGALTRRLAETGTWPKALALPTGAGKTAAIDAALFHLAMEADRGQERRAPVRIAFVVDRRLIVDEAHDRATRIAEALGSATGDGPLARMAARLRWLSGTDDPLIARRLRGGLPREDDWARTPAQPTVLCSTVDQVGSRLLFRGYGVSNGMKPVHAGLLGGDCLILLDEAHLSVPFRQTLAAVETHGAAAGRGDAPRRWSVVGLSATPWGDDEDRLTLTPADRATERLAKRLSAPKPAALRQCPLSAKEHPADHAEAFAAAAWTMLEALLKDAPSRALAVVVNRVALARAVHQALVARAAPEGGDGCEAEVVLLTGRIRDHDRASLLGRHKDRLASNGAGVGPPLIVVATQTIEAGADFDFDGLVTQIAPLDSLRQRFGRLNRMGRPGPARAVILAAKDEIAPKADDPVYGDRARRTWEWLNSVAETPDAPSPTGRRKAAAEPLVDFGIDALDARIAANGAAVAALSAEKPDAPILRRADVELLSWTAPIPYLDPELAPYLHGPKAGAADVQIVWRADLTAATLGAAGEVLALVPPHAGETLAVPLWAARAWLTGGPAGAVSDVEGVSDPDEPAVRSTNRRVLRWAGAGEDARRPVWPNELRGGDVIVVPADYGGCDRFGWIPAGTDPVADLGDHRPETWRPLRRLHPAFLTLDSQKKLSELLSEGDRTDREWMAALKEKGLIDEGDGWTEVHRPDDYPGLVLMAPKPRERPATAATEDDETGTLIGRAVPLAKHGEDVEAKARAFAERAGLSPKRVTDLALAARLHDEGKADRRFQAWLHGGDRLLAAIAEGGPLAKSPRRMTGRTSAAARGEAGLPPRWRHEVESVIRAVADPRLPEAADPELVLWLIGVHHGHGRPLFPHDDDRPGPQRPDFTFEGCDWPRMYERLKARYGVWELARMEAVVRLADHRASEDEENA